MKYTIACFYPPGSPTTYSYHAIRLLEAGLVELGHDVHVVSDAIEPDRRNILVNAHKLHGDMAGIVEDHDCVVLQTEMLSGGWLDKERLEEHYLPILHAAREVWEWVDMRNVADLGTWGIERVPMLLPGQHPWLREVHRQLDADIDVVFMGSPTDHRLKLFKELSAAKLGVAVIGPGLARPARNNILARAGVMLCPTDGELKYFTAARVAYAANNSIPCVIETPVHNPWPGCGYVVDEAVDACKQVCASPALAAELTLEAGYAVPRFVDNLKRVL
jgi:hypothetical protein